jgi:hypothetical protein
VSPSDTRHQFVPLPSEEIFAKKNPEPVLHRGEITELQLNRQHVKPMASLEDVTEIALRTAVRGAIIIGQMEMSDSQIECGAQHVSLRCKCIAVAKVVPQAQRQQWQLQAAASASAVLHFS